MSHRLTLLTVNGHPDDESVNAGGVMARYAAEGLRVVCVTCTRGEKGEIAVPEMNTPENLARLGEIREGELARALAHLGPIEQFWLGYADSGMMGTPGNLDPQSFWQADLEEAIGRLVRIVRLAQPDVIVTCNESGGDGHPDHIRSSAVARAAFARAGDPAAFPEQLAGPEALEPWTPSKLYETVIQLGRREKVARLLASRRITTIVPVLARYAWRWRPGQERLRSKMAATQGKMTTRVDVGPWLEAKHAALMEHQTQILPTDRLRYLTPAERRLVNPTEDFTLRESRVALVTPEDDLFAGLR